MSAFGFCVRRLKFPIKYLNLCLDSQKKTVENPANVAEKKTVSTSEVFALNLKMISFTVNTFKRNDSEHKLNFIRLMLINCSFCLFFFFLRCHCYCCCSSETAVYYVSVGDKSEQHSDRIAFKKCSRKKNRREKRLKRSKIRDNLWRLTADNCFPSRSLFTLNLLSFFFFWTFFLSLLFSFSTFLIVDAINLMAFPLHID